MLRHNFADVSKERSTFVISKKIWKISNTAVISLQRETSRSAVHVSIKYDNPKCFGMSEFRFKPGSVLRFAGVSLIPPLLDTLVSFIYTLPYINLATGSIVNLLTPNVNYNGRTAPLTSKVSFYIFIQQIYVLNILNMLYNLRFFLFKMQFVL